MKKTTIILCLLASAAAHAASLNVGSYNIRFQTADDTGDLDWKNRKEYVARTIKENNYDIIAINEMTVGQQLNDMKAMLPTYSFCGWGTNSATDPASGTFTSVLYLKDKFDLLDQGHYWLSTDPTQPKISWDCSNNNRMTAWAKLRVKATGEVLYYFATHMDHKGSDARNEGARINVEKIRSISGHYPAIIAGDHNSSPSRFPFYDLYAAYLNDARKVSATPFPWAKDGTLCKWDPNNTDNTRLDYIWVKGADVNTYVHINETFGRAVTPSDHMAIKANITLQPYQADHTRYVNALAPAGGDGSKTRPFNTLQAAIDATCNGDTIYVTRGDYSVTEQTGLTGAKATINVTHSLTILGGYDSNFKEVKGLSRIDGKGQVYRVMTVQKPYALELRDFEICGGRAADNTSVTTGAGIACLGARLDLERVTMRNNHAKSNGGAVYAAEQLLCRDCRFVGNSTEAYGGAIYTYTTGEKLWWRFVIENCAFIDNSANQGAAIYLGACSRALFANNSFVGNKAKQNGGGVALAGASVDCDIALVNNTFTGNVVEATPGAINVIKGGPAIYAKLSENSRITLVNNTIAGNYATCGTTPPDDFRGGAVNIYSGKGAFYANIIAGNSTNAADGFADIVSDNGKATSKSNIYSFRESVDFKKDLSDLVATDATSALNAIATLYGGKVVDGRAVLATVDEGYTFPVLPPATGFYCGNPINSMSNALYREKYLETDIDGDADISGSLIADQRGVEKRKDGTGTLGAYEYTPGAAIAGPAYNYVMGTYNVRIASDTEPGKLWADRKADVVRTITDTDFDVVGLTEVLEGEQHTDLENMLPEYDCDFRLVYNTSSKKQMNAVLWRRDRFEALDNGMFYLSPDVKSASIKFPGATQSRATVWAKLRDRNTGEIFYFFCCHMNRHEHYVAQREGARVITRMIRQIAGDYPAFFVGDMNSLPTEQHIVGPLSTIMTPAQDIANKPSTEPLITINFWTDDPNNKYQFDYVYVRHVDVDSCYTIKNFYGKNIAPSDHLAMAINCRLTATEKRLPSAVYLHPGDDIAEAVRNTAPGATIYLAEGEYTLPTGGLTLDKSYTFAGGYDDAFAEVTGSSTLRAAGNSRAIEVLGANFLELRNCNVSGGRARADGGAILSHGWLVDAADCAFTDNSAARGGAIYAMGDVTLSRCGFSGNSASQGGAALQWTAGTRAFITDCSANDNDGGSGAVLTLASPDSEALATLVNTSVFDNDGGIVANMAENGKLNVINCTVTRNQAAAAIQATTVPVNIHNSLVLANSALDVTADGKVTSAYNMYTSASDISFAAAKGDVVGAERASALTEAADIFGDKEAAGTTMLLPIHTPSFAGTAINALPNRELNEYALGTDLDNDFRTQTLTYLTHDQRGNTRPNDGTATRGAVEYGDNSGTGSIEAAPALLYDCRVVDLAGRTVAELGTVTPAEAQAAKGIQQGLYILVWRGGAAKIKY